MIVVPRDFVQGVVEECGRKGVKALIVISAGFGETGERGAALRGEAAGHGARRYGMRMVGPNCLGVLNTDPAVRLDATLRAHLAAPGAGRLQLAVRARSDSRSSTTRSAARHRHHAASSRVGNKADVSGNDLIEFWEQDPETDVILLYLESFGNPQKFIQLARRVAREEADRRGEERPHGGRLARRDLAHRRAGGRRTRRSTRFSRRRGVIRTDTIEELFDIALLLANQPVPAANRRGDRHQRGRPRDHGDRRVREPRARGHSALRGHHGGAARASSRARRP